MKKYFIYGLIFILCLGLWLPAVQAEDAGDSKGTGENEDMEDAEEIDKDIDMSQLQPSLVIESIRADEAIAGGEFYLTLVVRNWARGPALNVYPELKVANTDGLAPFSFKGTVPSDESPSLVKIEGEEAGTITIGLAIDREAINKDYKLAITLRCKNAIFKPAPTASALITVPVVYDRTKPQLLVSKVQLEPSEPVVGEPFTVNFFLENQSRVEARNVMVTLDCLDNYTLHDISNKKPLKNPILGGKVSSGISFTLAAKENREGNQVKLILSYTNQEEKQEELVTLPLDPEKGTSPRLEFADFNISQATAGRDFLVSVTLANKGQKEAQNVVLTLDGGGNILPLNAPSVRYLAPLKGGESRTLELALALNRAEATVYPLILNLEYGDRSGQKFTSEQTFGLASADIGATGSTPRVIISKYTLTPEQVFGGSVFSLGLDIENTNQKPVHNVKISLGVVELEGGRGDTVFSPIDSSNSFFLDYIPGKNVVTKEIDLFVDPNATARTYIVPVAIEYEDNSGNPLEAEELVTIPVTQEAKMEVVSVDIPPQAFGGQPVPIGAEFVNVGKVALDNFMVALEGDFPMENASYYVGRLEPGMGDYFQGMAVPAGEGMLEGMIVFTYLDGNNQEVRQEEPFSIPLMEMEPHPEEMMPPEEGPHHPGAEGAPMSTGMSLFLLAVMGVGAFFYKRREDAKLRSKGYFHE